MCSASSSISWELSTRRKCGRERLARAAEEQTACRRRTSRSTDPPPRHSCANFCAVLTKTVLYSQESLVSSITWKNRLLAAKLPFIRSGTRALAAFITRRTRRLKASVSRQYCLENSFSGERLFNVRSGLNRVRGVSFCGVFLPRSYDLRAGAGPGGRISGSPE